MATESHIKSTFKQAFIYSFSGILEKAIGFIMIPFYAHLLRGEGYGIIGMIEVVLSVLTVFIGYGVSGAMQRFYFLRNTEKEKDALISTAIILMFGMVFTVCIPAYFFNKQIALLAFGKEGLEIYIKISLFSFIAIMTSFSGQQYILIKQKPILLSVVYLLKFILALFLNIYLIIILRLGVLGVLYSQLITSSLFSIFVHFYTLRLTGLSFDLNDARDVLKYSIPLLPGYLAMFVRNNADRIILRNILGLTQLGVYSMVLKFALLIDLIIHDPFMKIFSVKRHEIADTNEGPQIIAKLFTFQMAIIMYTGLVLALETPLIIRIMTPNEFWVTGAIAFFAIFSRIALSSYYHLMYGILYAKATYKISVIQAIAAIVSVFANLLLIKYYGILGAFISSCLVFVVQCFLAFYFSNSHYKIPFEWQKISFMIVILIVFYTAINSINFEQIKIFVSFNKHAIAFIDKYLKDLFLSFMDQEKINLILNEKISVVTEGIIKGILSLAYIIFLVQMKIISISKIFEIFAPINTLITNITTKLINKLGRFSYKKNKRIL